MKKMIILLSHTLLDEQKEIAKKEFSIEKFIALPDKLQKMWANVPPELDFPVEIFFSIVEFLKQTSDKNDIILVQGDYGLTFAVVNWCFENNRLPIYATTKRETVVGNINNKIEKKSIFKHNRFRFYRSVV